MTTISWADFYIRKYDFIKNNCKNWGNSEADWYPQTVKTRTFRYLNHCFQTKTHLLSLPCSVFFKLVSAEGLIRTITQKPPFICRLNSARHTTLLLSARSVSLSRQWRPSASPLSRTAKVTEKAEKRDQGGIKRHLMQGLAFDA